MLPANATHTYGDDSCRAVDPISELFRVIVGWASAELVFELQLTVVLFIKLMTSNISGANSSWMEDATRRVWLWWGAGWRFYGIMVWPSPMAER